MSSPHCQELLDFQMNDNNFMKMIHIVDSLLQKLKAAWISVSMAKDAFNTLDKAVPSHNSTTWNMQEQSALSSCIHNISIMDIFEIQLKKEDIIIPMEAPTVCTVELKLLEAMSQPGTSQGVASWLTHGLAIEAVETMLSITWKEAGRYPSEQKRLTMACHADHLTSEHSRFVTDGQIYLELLNAWGQTDDHEDYSICQEDDSHSAYGGGDVFTNDEDSDGSADDVTETATLKTSAVAHLPLPSNVGVDACHTAGAYQLAEMELQLQIGQANDALHGLHLALANKAVVFRGVVWKATSSQQAFHNFSSQKMLKKWREEILFYL
ncbi:hypothetical protein BKA83DRAFT_4492952 [Pisolithus microcarpus]|nr:hypothetical protein BKA83DRAFT_4492952 [Pisolithus microcarpus]